MATRLCLRKRAKRVAWMLNSHQRLRDGSKELDLSTFKWKSAKCQLGRGQSIKKEKDIGAWNLFRLQTGLIGFYMRVGTTQLE